MRPMTLPIRDCSLPPTSTYASWPADLLATLCRSYKAHSGSVYGGTLPGAFEWDSQVEPANFEQALDKAGASAVKVVYDRVSFHAGLWAFVDVIEHAWHQVTGNQDGFRFGSKDPTSKRALINFLDSSARFCRDTPVMQYYHQSHPSAGSRVLVPTHQCWREVVNRSPGLHICVVNAGDYWSEMHIDAHQIVKGKNSDGTCNYALVTEIFHAWDIRKVFGK